MTQVTPSISEVVLPSDQKGFSEEVARLGKLIAEQKDAAERQVKEAILCRQAEEANLVEQKKANSLAQLRLEEMQRLTYEVQVTNELIIEVLTPAVESMNDVMASLLQANEYMLNRWLVSAREHDADNIEIAMETSRRLKEAREIGDPHAKKRQELIRRRNALRRNHESLLTKKVQYGIDVPTHVMNEIKATTEELEQVEEEIANLPK
jgi:hypothetical protein